MNSPKEVLEKLLAGDFQSLIGIAESVWIDAKETPYVRDTRRRSDVVRRMSALREFRGRNYELGSKPAKTRTAIETISRTAKFSFAGLQAVSQFSGGPFTRRAGAGKCDVRTRKLAMGGVAARRSGFRWNRHLKLAG